MRIVLAWKLTEAEKAEIKELWAAGLPVRLIGREAGVPYSTVSGHLKMLTHPASPARTRARFTANRYAQPDGSSSWSQLWMAWRRPASPGLRLRRRRHGGVTDHRQQRTDQPRPGRPIPVVRPDPFEPFVPLRPRPPRSPRHDLYHELVDRGFTLSYATLTARLRAQHLGPTR